MATFVINVICVDWLGHYFYDVLTQNVYRAKHVMRLDITD